MNRQLIIGSLIGIALGGVLTASIENGVFAADRVAKADQAASDEADAPHEAADPSWSSFDGVPPLRPGSQRVGAPLTSSPTLELPVALDAQSVPTTPTV